jgi:hypothetical protein
MRRPKAKSNDKLIAGIDLHSDNVMIGVTNQEGRRLLYRKLDCNLQHIVDFLEPLKPRL